MQLNGVGLREARIANEGRYCEDAYRAALDVQTASNLSGVARNFAVDVLPALWDEARSLGEGTEYMNTHPVVGLFLHQMAHLNKSHANLLGDKWREAHELCEDMCGKFFVEVGPIRVYETSSDFQIVHIPSGQQRSMGDCVDRYADADTDGTSYHVGTPQFYALFRDDVKTNWAVLEEAFFGADAERPLPSDGFADGGAAYTEEELGHDEA